MQSSASGRDDRGARWAIIGPRGQVAMPGHARKDIVREGEIGVYHTWSRCVQRAHLCGEDYLTGQNFDHRRTWIRRLLEYQASVFAVDVGNYSILSNHQHLIARTRPDIAATWSDEEVAWRWKLAWPQWKEDQWLREPTDEEIEEVLAEPERLPIIRSNLASLSWFMARWKEPVAKLCNAESEKKGHFYEQRFGSREIVDDPANLCCNVYVDLNQLKAGMASTLEECRCSAIYDRLQSWRQREAQESVERFEGTNPSEDYRLQTGDVEELLADCFLAPIGDRGPSLLVGNTLNTSQPIVIRTHDAADNRAPLSSGCESVVPVNQPQPITSDAACAIDAEPQGCGTPTAGNDLPVASVDDAGPGVGKLERRVRRKPTRTIHRRLQPKRRRRASEHAYLGIPWDQYRDIVQWTAGQLHQATAAQPPPEVEIVLRGWGVEPSKWCTVIERFGEMFHRAVGHVDQLVDVARRTGRKWLQGSRACRDVFT
jgi:hypothetical protein